MSAEMHPKYEDEFVASDAELPLDLPQLRSVTHDLHVEFGPRWGLQYSLTCPNGPGSACHWYIDDETGKRVEDDECVVLPWFNYDTVGAIEGYAGPDRDSVVSGPIVVLASNEDEFAWEYLG